MCGAFSLLNRALTAPSPHAYRRYCNFMHLRPISRDLRKDLFGRYKKSKRDRDRSPGCDFEALTRDDHVPMMPLTVSRASAVQGSRAVIYPSADVMTRYC